MLIVLFMDKTVFLLNLYVQSMGYYFQNILQLGFPLPLYRIATRLGGSPLSIPVTAASVLLALLFFAFHVGQIGAEGCWSLALVVYITFAAVVSVLRTQVRQRLHIPGSP